MGYVLNKGNGLLNRAKRSRIYVDKSGIIAELNKLINSEQCFACQSRPRRFGKSMAANMISAYYDCTCRAQEDFAGMSISQDPGFLDYANKYNVLFLTMTDYVDGRGDIEELKKQIK